MGIQTAANLTKGHTAAQKMGGDFAPVLRFTKDNTKAVGVYQGRGQFKTPDGKMATSHNFKLTGLDAGVEVVRSKEALPAAEITEGMLVSTSGHILDSNLTDALIGKTIGISFIGKRKTARNGSPVNVFELEVYEEALA